MTIGTILSALVALPKIGALIESLISSITLWYIQRQTTQTLSQIADAAALASRAQTDDERYQAAQAWQSALSRSRVS